MVSALVAWACRLSLVAGTLLAASGGVAAALANPVPTVALVLAVGLRRLRRRGHSLNSQGSARFAAVSDLSRANLLSDKGLIVGRVDRSIRPTRRAAVRCLVNPRVRSADATRAFLAAFFGGKGHAGRFIRVCDYVHLSTFAPTGRGKGQSVLKVNLLTHPGSVVVVDPDAELLRDVGERREQAFGGRSIVLAPYGVPGRPGFACDTLNPMDFIDPDSPNLLSDCAKLASLLVIRSGKEADSHWLDSAELILTGLIAFTIACETDQNLRTFQVVRGIVASPDRFSRTIEHMKKVTGFGGVIARLGNQLQWFRDKELASCMTTLNRLTAVLDLPVVAVCLGRSSFDPAILRTGASLYLCLPSDRMAGLAQVMRLWLGTILSQLTRDAADESKTVLFLIDEAANIGHIAQLEEAVVLLRKRGIRLWFFWQSRQQLNTCYGDRAGVFLDNIDTQQYFGQNSFEAGEAISKRLGQETILVSSTNTNSGGSRQSGNGTGPATHSSNSGSGTTWSEQGRALMRPEEILALDGKAIVFHKSHPPILATLPLAHKDPEFQPGGAVRRRPVGGSALLLSLSWLVLGSVVFTFGMNQAEQAPLPSLDLAAWRGRVVAWTGQAEEEPLPFSDSMEIHAWLSKVELQAEIRRDRKYEDARDYLRHRLPVPPHLHKQVTDTEYVETLQRARARAEWSLRRLAALAAQAAKPPAAAPSGG